MEYTYKQARKDLADLLSFPYRATDAELYRECRTSQEYRLGNILFAEGSGIRAELPRFRDRSTLDW